jgi:serine carboxypeptidase 1
LNLIFFNIIVTEAHMFWWLYRSPYRVEDSSKPWPIVLWLQGGPVSITELIKIKFESEF